MSLIRSLPRTFLWKHLLKNQIIRNDLLLTCFPSSSIAETEKNIFWHFKAGAKKTCCHASTTWRRDKECVLTLLNTHLALAACGEVEYSIFVQKSSTEKRNILCHSSRVLGESISKKPKINFGRKIFEATFSLEAGRAAIF